ncbi:ADP-ribosylation [Thelephora ganbajun]|uniref:ADP-ribosylation n=1 Tax=Thelephora ganbajun TaxID=370292 RepID=A0ACB6ZG92_THEGA|nr:ADP-ribosylation [Thelephora ganbajun]
MQASSANTQNNRFSVYQTTSLCQTPGCLSPAYVGPNGVAGKYCTKTHKQWGENGCISCRKAPTNGVVVFCQLCYNKALRKAPMIVEVPEGHEKYKSVASQFRQKWLHNNKCPEVRAIYKIVSTMASLTKYEQYLDRVEAKVNFASQNKPRGNERRRWHGTTRMCNIGDKGVTKLCSNPSCSLCCIMRTSFDLSFFAKNTRFGKFGVGIYTSSTSSKSNDYSRNGCISNWKAMLLNKVVVGRGYKMTVSNATLTEPPAGYDSVLAEVGTCLNYDELVVYDNNAIRSSYLVIQERVFGYCPRFTDGSARGL